MTDMPVSSLSTSQLREIIAQEIRNALNDGGLNAVDAEQAMKILGCRRTKLRELIRDGKITLMKRTGRKIMINLVSIKTHLCDVSNQVSN